MTRSYRNITVTTVDGGIYQTMELVVLDNSIAIYEKRSDRRVLIPNHQIKSIEYEYEKTTIADFIDKEH